LSHQGHIVVYSPEDLILNVYSINCQLLKSTELSDRVNQLTISQDSQYLITGEERGSVTVRYLHNLEVVHRFPGNSPVTCLALTGDKHLFVGHRNGRLFIYA